jgi:hypothetical protein
MYTLPQDIYKTYPNISRALPLVSKQLSALSLDTACNTFPSDKEIQNFISEGKFVKLGIMFVFINEREYESQLHMFLDDKMVDLYLKKDQWLYFQGKVKEIPTFEISNLKGVKDEMLVPDDIVDYMNMKYHQYAFPDIITMHKIFSKRTLCKQMNQNYAKQMTKKYFNHIVSQLNAPSLYSYLISNAIILNYDISPKKVSKDSKKLDGEDIKSYRERFNDEIKAYTYDINNSIDKL